MTKAMRTTALSVAVPWSLSHYIPLNGFHPLYRALFDDCPKHVKLNAWDNTVLSNVMRREPALRREVVDYIAAWQTRLGLNQASSFEKVYYDAFYVPNLAATALLPGDIELHHTALFPSMTRPFVVHCESFAPFFMPFAQQGGATIKQAISTRAHYAKMLENDLCLGVFSHLQHTLDELSRFFQSDVINQKLFSSRIGISRHALAQCGTGRGWGLAAPVFLFINSANQNPQNFVHRGGHIILRAWPGILAACPGAKLYIRCSRPTDALLIECGVDIDFVGREESRSIIWIPEFATNRELNNLMRAAHFFLLPSISLHSVSIMQAMSLGAIPVVTDTFGPSRYVSDRQTGIVLQGVQAGHWRPDPATGIMVDNFDRDAALDERLVHQLASRVTALWRDPDAFAALQKRAALHAATELSGFAFAEDFWTQVNELWASFAGAATKLNMPKIPNSKLAEALHDCLVEADDWPRLFESAPQPLRRLYTGTSFVTELGGNFVCTRACGIDLHGWSVFAEYCRDSAVPLRMATSIDALGGAYLTTQPEPLRTRYRRRFVLWVARVLAPSPTLYRIAARTLRWARRLRAKISFAVPPPPLDIQLIEQNVSGWNIIRCADLYYAIPQDAGEFSLNKLREGGYRLSFIGNSLRQVMDKVAQHRGRQESARDMSTPIELVEEGFHGLNLIRYADLFVAIPQGEGVFDYDRAVANGYSRSFSDTSLMGLKRSILQASS